MVATWSFCKKCEKYHVNWDKDGLDKMYETHLNSEEKMESLSFPIYRKQLDRMSGAFMVLADPGPALQYAMKEYPSGFFEPRD